LLGGQTSMLSVDQFLRLISAPAVVAAFLIASQVSGAGIFQPRAGAYVRRITLDGLCCRGRLSHRLQETFPGVAWHALVSQ